MLVLRISPSVSPQDGEYYAEFQPMGIVIVDKNRETAIEGLRAAIIAMYDHDPQRFYDRVQQLNLVYYTVDNTPLSGIMVITNSHFGYSLEEFVERYPNALPYEKEMIVSNRPKLPEPPRIMLSTTAWDDIEEIYKLQKWAKDLTEYLRMHLEGDHK